MHHLLVDEVVPYLRNLHIGQVIKVVKLRTTGIFESALAELIMPALRLEPGVRLAYLPSYSGVDLRVIASGTDDSEAQSKSNMLVKYLENVCGKFIFGRDTDSLEGVVGKLLRDRKQTVSVAESCTGGQLGMVLTSISGASDYFVGGVISYANEVKSAQLGVSERILANDGAVSEAVATAMAQGARERFGSTYALSITGIAGPSGATENKPVGLVYVGVASPQRAFAKKFNFGIDREINRTRATYSAIEQLRREILGIS
jgi:nicotinamide-nucleotide amidase